MLNGIVGEAALAAPFALWLQSFGLERGPSEIGATALVVGQPNPFVHTQLFSGLDVYPAALTLVPGGSKALRVQVKDGDLVSSADSGVQYFAVFTD